MDKYCQYAVIKKQGSRSWLYCNKTNQLCMFQRYCIRERRIVNSLEAISCKVRNEK